MTGNGLPFVDQAGSTATGATLAARAPAMAKATGTGRPAWNDTCSAGMVAAICRSVTRFCVRGVFRDVQVPTLVVHRSEDICVPVGRATFDAQNHRSDMLQG